MANHGKPNDPFEHGFMANPPAVKPGEHRVGPYRFTEDELDDLLGAVWQVLDDFGQDGAAASVAAKFGLRIALEPFARNNPDLECDYSLDEALKTRDGGDKP